MRPMSPLRRAGFLGLVLALALGCGSAGKPATPAGVAGQAGAGTAGASGAGIAGAAGGATGAAGASGVGGGVGTAGASGTGGGSAGAGASGQAGGGAPDGGTDADGGADTRADGSTLPPGTGCGVTGTICWDFEEGKLPMGWTPYRNEYPTGSLLVDNTRAHRGTYALHAKDFTGGNEGADGGPKHTIRYALPAGFGPVLWGRAFVYLTPGVPMSHAGFFNARYPAPNIPATSTDVTKLDWYEVATSGGKYVSIWHPPEPPGTPEAVQISDTAGVVDAWACVEWLFDAQNGTAAEAADARVFLNGVEITWPMMIVAPTGAARPVHDKAQSFTVLETGVYLYQGLTTATSWWIDDLAVGKQRIGCD
jgi:hypothetical protein